jgi:hypothetical protein
MSRAKGKNQAKQTSSGTLPLPILESKDRERFMFELNMNLVPYPHRPLGRKMLPVITCRSQMVPWSLYWVRIWDGGNGAGNWALCEHTTLTGDGIQFKILASTSPWETELPGGIVTMIGGALEQKRIRLAQFWHPLTPTVEPVQPRMKMNIFRSKSVPASYATKLLRNGTLREHVLNHISQFGESATGEYNVKVHGSGHITVGAAGSDRDPLHYINPSKAVQS